MARFARQHKLELRFIEYMPLDADGTLVARRRAFAAMKCGPVIEEQRRSARTGRPINTPQPARHRLTNIADGGGRVGFINSVTQPFCAACDRLRLTAEGQIRNCLFSTVEWDAREVMRGGGSDEQLAEQLIRACVAAKKVGHGIDTPEFVRPERAMYQIGG